jgi:saccharopine dehydrogenase (NAD+, L-lysine-forming)
MLDKKTKTIGILGATGYVGEGAVETMLGFTDYTILLGGRNLEKLRTKYANRSLAIHFLHVDIFDSESLLHFCGMCDMVVNCAGPSKHILDRVAFASLEQSAHYVDVSGDEQLHQLIMKRKQEIEAKQLSFVISAGVYPGLSEIIPAYIAQTYFDEVDMLELFFAGHGEFSLNAAYDIVCSIQEDTCQGMSYCNQGTPSKIEGSFHSTYTLPSPAGKRVTYPILNYEFVSMARTYGLRSAWLYNTYADKSVLNKFVMIKALEQYLTEDQKRVSARTIADHFGTNRHSSNDYTMFHLVAIGNKKGIPVQLDAQMLYRNDWNTLSGIVAANVARLILDEDQRITGCFLAAERVSATHMIQALSDQDVVFTHSMKVIERS